MADYRAYAIGPDGHLSSSRCFFCSDDGEAIAKVKLWMDGQDMELWNEDRLVAKLKSNEPEG